MNDRASTHPGPAGRRCQRLSPSPLPLDGGPAIGGITPFSSVDWPGCLSAVVFIAGCPWRCHYCHNPHLQQRHAFYDWDEVCGWLDERRGLLDAVVFSGGEALSERRLPAMAERVKRLGYRVGLHSAGIYPARLAAVLPHLDWVGLDVKTAAPDYAALTGRRGSAWAAEVSLQLLLESGCDFECRTTWSPTFLSEMGLLELARGLAARGVRHYAVQNQRGGPGERPGARLDEATLRSLRECFESFEYR